MTRDPNAAAKSRDAERRANEEAGLKSIDLSSLAASSSASGNALSARKGVGASAQPQKKKPVFKSTLQPHNVAAVLGTQQGSAPVLEGMGGEGVAKASVVVGDDSESRDASAGAGQRQTTFDLHFDPSDPDLARLNGWAHDERFEEWDEAECSLCDDVSVTQPGTHHAHAEDMTFDWTAIQKDTDRKADLLGNAKRVIDRLREKERVRMEEERLDRVEVQENLRRFAEMDRMARAQGSRDEWDP